MLSAKQWREVETLCAQPSEEATQAINDLFSRAQTGVQIATAYITRANANANAALKAATAHPFVPAIKKMQELKEHLSSEVRTSAFNSSAITMGERKLARAKTTVIDSVVGELLSLDSTIAALFGASPLDLPLDLSQIVLLSSPPSSPSSPSTEDLISLIKTAKNK
jgi:hypothetical protein